MFNKRGRIGRWVFLLVFALCADSELFDDKIFLTFDRACLSRLNGDIREDNDGGVSRFASRTDEIRNQTATLMTTPEHLEGLVHRVSAYLDIEEKTRSLKARNLVPKTSSERARIRLLSLLHIRLAASLLGSDNVQRLIELEETGDVNGALELIVAKASSQLKSSFLRNLMTQPSPKKNATDEPHEMRRRGVPVLMSPEHLDILDITIVKNPLGLPEILKFATDLPCLKAQPEFDRDKESLTEFVAEKSTTTPLPPIRPFERLKDDKLSQRPIYAKSRYPHRPSPSLYTFYAPNDAHFPHQWYLFGPGQEENYGANVVNGWSTIIARLNRKRNPEGSRKRELRFEKMLEEPSGIEVAVLDSGCAPNPDLEHNLDTEVNKKCEKEDGDDKCQYFIKPSKEDKIHGSSTGGIIAAQSDNKIGIAGICPTCKILCLKIYDSDKQKITLSAVIKALEVVAKRNIKLSNHSYGGFGESAVELEAHRLLQSMGHLSICAAGNNGCNIDIDATKEDGGCRGPTGLPLGPFTPAAYPLSSILSVGATTRKGKLAWFSNYGPRTVHIFAPGDEILTLYGTNKLATVKGTSFAAPVVAGVAAMMWSHRPSLTVAEVRRILMDSGTRLYDLEGKGIVPVIPNLQAAIDSKLLTPSRTFFSAVSPSNGPSSLFSKIPIIITSISFSSCLIGLIWVVFYICRKKKTSAE